MDAAEGSLLAPEPSVLVSIVDILFDPSALAVLLATLFGFVLPMLWIYPPVAPRPSNFLNETHSKLGLATGKLDDDETAKSASRATKKPAAPVDDKSSGRIESLWVYPVKSCQGIQVSRSRVLPAGLEFDRLFTFAQLQSPFPARAGTVVRGNGNNSDDDHDNNGNADELETWDAITQRQFPMLASLQVELWRPDLAKVRRAQKNMRADYRAERADSMSELYVVVRYPWQAAGWPGRWDWFAAKLLRGWRAEPEVEVVLPVALPAADDRRAQAATKYGRVQLGDDRNVRALDLSAELPRSLQLYLGVSNRLGVLRLDTEQVGSNMRNPLYLVNESSVAPDTAIGQADDKAPESVKQRLRANVVVHGIAAHDEKTWNQVSFKPPPSSESLLDEATFEASEHQQRGSSRGIQLMPVFDALDKADLMELTLETGMSVCVLKRGS
ncbi:hypothetical protein SCUCBS95973_006788 [Sporothrix curviconia]|uniref:Molybdenum cofactor sulfurase middle domain-containing protein n=1 Tax=Sporothrix curviconia TaxID=1260050 RepID=A0ABP0C9J1_9PEZI